MKKYSKKQIVHCILVTACMFIVSGVWIAISTKNYLEPFFNDARSRLEEKYQRTVQIDRYMMYAFRVQTPTLTIGLVSMVQCISSEKLKNNQKRIFRNII